MMLDLFRLSGAHIYILSSFINPALHQGGVTPECDLASYNTSHSIHISNYNREATSVLTYNLAFLCPSRIPPGSQVDVSIYLSSVHPCALLQGQ